MRNAQLMGEDAETAAPANMWSVCIVTASKDSPDEAPGVSEPGIPVSGSLPAATEENIEYLRERFSFVYPHAYAPDLPSKLTVTELKGSRFSYGADDGIRDSELLIRDSPADVRERHFAFDRPEFIIKEGALSATERGTALHLAMQHIDFEKCGSAESISGELQRLMHKGILSQAQTAAVDIQKITGFFGSDIGRRILKAKNVRREFKFSLLCPAEDFYTGGGDDKILLQGIIDCFFEEDGELTVVDFKTDRITPDRLEERAAHYTPQLAAYSDAISRITGKRAKDRIIYFFALDKAVSVE